MFKLLRFKRSRFLTISCSVGCVIQEKQIQMWRVFTGGCLNFKGSNNNDSLEWSQTLWQYSAHLTSYQFIRYWITVELSKTQSNKYFYANKDLILRWTVFPQVSVGRCPLLEPSFTDTDNHNLSKMIIGRPQLWSANSWIFCLNSVGL